MAKAIGAFLADETGATAIEYALLGTLLAVTIVGTFAVLGDSLFNLMGAGTGGAADVIGNSTETIPD